ncbi:G protein-coupled receptor, rhodopsin-like family and GPCR, rhodopsin-like, 7TM domain-containing protein [Strongyloides ratti]|uniref:G protein-coupled receptor, rhodopsin-like family and GPCR, rhodopsin-like, 7TM domain-containing protein n=1 Tax=Strongyloides ratti TaxID=34506 RepID=A0A090LNY5_STRRB|nr:G protein-coupled receptor, rhodopsin-like family and GPCR, rhodopsin-like, 7TM domain-containing protein [Strongyloides ratti]CEF71476.1 G protein-coupled receptor, rhodopsin-like family and GPCR, rhodopsin-like, 7TM domain-containing protein [Strongyloides ratti]
MWVIVSFIRVIINSNKSKCLRTYNAAKVTRCFVLILAITDLVVLMTLPVTIANVLLRYFPLGSFYCRLHTAIDQSGKLISIVILMCMSIERYLVVCTKWRYSSTRKLATIGPLVFAIIICVCIPLYPQIRHTRISYILVPINETSKIENKTICIYNIPPEWVTTITNYNFLTGFAIPLTIMSICYIMLVKHVKNKFKRRSKNKNFSNSNNISLNNTPKYIFKLTNSIRRIAIFHFCCWAPFWIYSITPQLLDYFNSKWILRSSWYNTGQLVANMLPYVNSAGNCILYAFLNHDVRNNITNKRNSVTHSYNKFPNHTTNQNPSTRFL